MMSINKYLVILLVSTIFLSCTNESKEKKMLNKKDSIGLYGNPITKERNNDPSLLFKQPNLYLNKEVLITGKILEVCPMRGCWINIEVPKNPQNYIRVKVTDGEIVFPLSSKGKNAKVQGIFQKLEFSYEQAKNWKIHLEEEKGNAIDPDTILVSPEDLVEYRIIGSGIKIF